MACVLITSVQTHVLHAHSERRARDFRFLLSLYVSEFLRFAAQTRCSQRAVTIIRKEHLSSCLFTRGGAACRRAGFGFFAS